MAKQAANTILSSLNLSDSQKQNVSDKITERRNKLLKKLEEQKLVAEAALRDEEYFGKKTVSEIDEDGNKTTIEVPKRVNRWFYTNNGSEWYLEIKYGNRVLQLAMDKAAIVVGSLENMVDVIDKVMNAVSAKELDEAIEVALMSKK